SQLLAVKPTLPRPVNSQLVETELVYVGGIEPAPPGKPVKNALVVVVPETRNALMSASTPKTRRLT
ncbi:hypothetical protein, partial [Bradyrhizobium sp.]|uniref:hypothetical protein n=1 Tax=Bradyrhizobium sp. TaxID=376 RepID=UPI003BB1555C